jgi:hypothetical protein
LLDFPCSFSECCESGHEGPAPYVNGTKSITPAVFETWYEVPSIVDVSLDVKKSSACVPLL